MSVPLQYDLVKSEPPQEFVVGIDPQPSLLAVCVKHLNTGKRIAWFQVLLKRKDSFPKAGDWESYIVDQCIRTVSEIETHIANVFLGVQNKMFYVDFAVEQQRGRVKTIPETCLATAARARGWTIRIPHPNTWKKGMGFTAEVEDSAHIPRGNKENKAWAQKLYEKSLIEHCKSKGTQPPKVTHHLCDAACIADYLDKLRREENERESQQQQQTTASYQI